MKHDDDHGDDDDDEDDDGGGSDGEASTHVNANRQLVTRQETRIYI